MKKVFLFLTIFVLISPLTLSRGTIEVVGSNAGISISGPSILRKQIKREVGISHAYTSECQTDPPTGHPVNITIVPVTLTVSGTVSGYGAAGGAFRSAVIDGETVADWNGAVGEQSQTLDTVGVCGFKGTTPKAYKEDKSISFSLHGESTQKLGTDHQWSATAGIYTRGIEWIGIASSSVEIGLLVNLNKKPELQVYAKKSGGETMRYQQARDRGWSSASDRDEWEVTEPEPVPLNLNYD